MTEHADSAPRMPALVSLREGLVDAARREPQGVRARRGWQLTTALAVLCALAATAVVLATGREDGVGPGVTANANDLIAPQTAPGFVSGGPHYETLEQLAANSAMVVTGTVTGVRSGGEIVDIDPEYPTRFVHAVVRVDQVLKGSVQRPTVTVRTVESAYAAVPGASSGPDLEWRRPGERIVAFLAPSPDGGPLAVPTSYSQSFYRLDDGDVVPLAAKPGAGDAAQGHAMPLPEFAAAVRAAGQ
jgi:hypothetical protein